MRYDRAWQIFVAVLHKFLTCFRPMIIHHSFPRFVEILAQCFYCPIQKVSSPISSAKSSTLFNILANVALLSSHCFGLTSKNKRFASPRGQKLDQFCPPNRNYCLENGLLRRTALQMPYKATFLKCREKDKRHETNPKGSCHKRQKKHKRQRRKRQSVTAKREKSQTPNVMTTIQT